MDGWNPWHGCKKTSPGCKNCYVYRRDESIGKDASIVYKTKTFNLPVRKKRNGSYVFMPNGEVFTCGTSDFFIDEADRWRVDAWNIIKERKDINFLIITKRIHRFCVNLPYDWGSGYDNVRIGCTVENMEMAKKRLPVFLKMPIKHKIIICEPLLEALELSEYLNGVDVVVAGGESGLDARPCDFEWIKSLREQCSNAGIGFWFKQTGAKFLKDGKKYRILKKYQHSQARKAGLNIYKDIFIDKP